MNMKKIIALLFACILLCSGLVFAEEELQKSEPVTIDGFSTRPGSYFEINLMSVDGEAKKAELAKRLFAGWENLEQEIVVADLNIPAATFLKWYSEILDERLDEFYFARGSYQYSYYKDPQLTIHAVYPGYLETDTEVIQATVAAICKETENILFNIDENMSDFDKVMAVHDYMVLNYHYDLSSTPNHSITMMVTKTGVCQSYALAFLHLMHELEIPCIFVGSEAMNHAWNLVQVEGDWYHIDLTWDDPVSDKFAEVRHTYALLSDEALRNSAVRKPHFGYELNGIANSKRYDNAPWHTAFGSIVYLDGVEYYVDGTSLIDSNGKVIYKGLAGKDDAWNINEKNTILIHTDIDCDGEVYQDNHWRDAIYAGVAEYNGIIYFNSDTAIHAYDPKTQKITEFAKEKYVCGLYVDHNVLRYSKYDNGRIYDAGSIKLDAVRYAAPYVKNGKVVAKVCKADDEPMKIFSFGGDGCQLADVTTDGVTTVTFDAKEGQKLFFWTEHLKPLREPITVTK